MNKFKQYILIISGFILGQGSMFLAQTWLVVQQQLELVASVGIGLSILSLMQWAADCGGLYLLPRQINDQDFRQKLWAFIFARLIFSLIFTIFLVLILVLIDINQTILNIAFFGCLSAFIWSFNVSGILDAKHLNRLAGPLSGLCWIFSSIPVFFMSDAEIFGELVGLGYAAGLLITVLIQFVTLQKIDAELSLAKVPFALIKHQFIDGAKYNGAYITSQAYGRAIPILVDRYLDSYTAGVYIYAKNIANTVSQFVDFSRRVEFASIVQLINIQFNVLMILIKQKLGFFIITFFLILSLITDFALQFSNNLTYKLISEVTLILIAITFLWVVSSALGQAIIALEKTGYYATTITTTLVISLITIVSSIEKIGLVSVFIGESLMFAIQIVLYVSVLKKISAAIQETN